MSAGGGLLHLGNPEKVGARSCTLAYLDCQKDSHRVRCLAARQRQLLLRAIAETGPRKASFAYAEQSPGALSPYESRSRLIVKQLHLGTRLRRLDGGGCRIASASRSGSPTAGTSARSPARAAVRRRSAPSAAARAQSSAPARCRGLARTGTSFRACSCR